MVVQWIGSACIGVSPRKEEEDIFLREKKQEEVKMKERVGNDIEKQQQHKTLRVGHLH